MIMCHSAGNWGFYTIISLLPKYMADYQGKQIKEIGVMSSLPYVLQTVTILIATALADMLQVSWKFNYSNSLEFLKKSTVKVLSWMVKQSFKNFIFSEPL